MFTWSLLEETTPSCPGYAEPQTHPHPSKTNALLHLTSPHPHQPSAQNKVEAEDMGNCLSNIAQLQSQII